jgi:diguanylate cyclase
MIIEDRPYISPRRFTDRIDHVNTQVMGEIEQVMAMIGAAAGTASSYSENLANVTRSLGGAADEPAVRAIVEGLVQATKDMERNNQSLEARLSASKQEINQLQENLDAVRTESLTDPLTTLANRKYFDQALTKAIGDARDKGQPLALLMTDIDHFKHFNDTYGHLTGDQVLRLVATSLKQNVKGHDLAARYGGEEFAVVLPNMPLPSAVGLADQIRRAVETKELKKRSTGELLGRVTISIGVAALGASDTAQMLIERADGCLRQARRPKPGDRRHNRRGRSPRQGGISARPVQRRDFCTVRCRAGERRRRVRPRRAAASAARAQTASSSASS